MYLSSTLLCVSDVFALFGEGDAALSPVSRIRLAGLAMDINRGAERRKRLVASKECG